MLSKTGEIKHLMVDSNVNFNKDGSFRHTRCFIRNDLDRCIGEAITKIEKKNAAASAAARDRFIRRVFHEIRTPLHIMTGYLGLDSMSAEDIEELKKHTGTSQKPAERFYRMF
jgi:signal transduction histidine kinase